VWAIVNKSFSYTPATAALDPSLLATRPDALVLRYIQDYIQIAGTYPCGQNENLAYYDESRDAVLNGEIRVCPFPRPVAAVTIDHVYVGIIGPDTGFPEAIVGFTITYADGSRWTNAQYLTTYQNTSYDLAYLHLTCWGSFATTLFYPDVDPHIPNGAAWIDPHVPENADVVRCQP
jgi:hypothetical protein